MLVDTHTHLYIPEFNDSDNGQVEVVNRALAAGVGYMIFPCVDEETLPAMLNLAAQYPSHVGLAMGLHPTSVGADWQERLTKIIDMAPKEYLAIGEIGIDLYWDKTFAHEQMQAFDAQVAMAVSKRLPVIIHCRDGLNETLEVLKGHPGVRAVFHSFGGTVEDIEAIRAVGDFYFGINGIVTFKNCKVKETLQAIGLDRLLLETDAPYLAPMPHRGHRNESAYLTDTAAFIATYLQIPLQELHDKTTDNAKTLFNLKLSET